MFFFADVDFINFFNLLFVAVQIFELIFYKSQKFKLQSKTFRPNLNQYFGNLVANYQ